MHGLDEKTFQILKLIFLKKKIRFLQVKTSSRNPKKEAQVSAHLL